MCQFPYLVEVSFATHDDLQLGLVATQRLEVPVLAADDVEAGLCVTAMGEVDDVGAVTAATMQLSEPTDGQCGGGFRR